MPRTYTINFLLVVLALIASAIGCSNKERVEETVSLAQTALDNGKVDLAKEYADEALSLRDSDPDIRVLAAKAHRADANAAAEQGEFEHASNAFANAAEREPYRKQRATDWYNAWEQGRDAGLDTVDIAPFLEASIADDPSNLEVRRAAATTFDELGEAERAIEQYLWVWEADRSQAAIGLRLGALFVQVEEYDDAEAVFRRVIDADPKNVQAHLQLADVYESMGRSGRARSLYQQLVDDYPDNPSILFRYADFLERTGRKGEAGRVRARAKGEMPGVKRRKMRRLR